MRSAAGGTSLSSVKQQIEELNKMLQGEA
jgi:hypothetical protein